MSSLLAARTRYADLDPARLLWRVLTSVRFALALIGFLALASLAGVLLAQVPSQMRGNPAAIDAWLEFQRGKFGAATDVLNAAGLFDVFHSLWFAALLALLVVSVGVCTSGRFGPVWRNVFRPQERVPDDYFERGQPVVSLEAPEVGALVGELRRRRYRVSVSTDPAGTYVFADRFAWAQLATFVSHLALVLFIAGGLVTVLTAKEELALIAEGTSRPIFDAGDRDHMQVYVDRALGRFDASGFPLDYRTSLVVYRDGREVARGESTINDPLRYGGYRFHQTAYFADGVALRVRDAASGRSVYEEVLPLQERTPAPRVVLNDKSGDVLVNTVVVPTDFVEGASGTSFQTPGGPPLWVGATKDGGGNEWRLVVYEASGTGKGHVVREGASAEVGGVVISFAGMTTVPSAEVRGIPGAPDGALLEASEGEDGRVLTLAPVEGKSLTLAEGESVVVGGLEYAFVGPRAFAGITVRKDAGSTFIWVATGLLLAGLALTFYLPRRRLWGKIAGGSAAFRGLGGRSAAIEQEIRQAARAAKSGKPRVGADT